MHTGIIGTQFGDEGKGKIIDILAKEHDYIVRCQGGDNAGHTVMINDNHYAFHLLPSAVLHPGKVCILGNGMVINPDKFFDEIKTLEDQVTEHAKILISDRAHIITNEHILKDSKTGKKVGTTKRGVGPCYEEKMHRKNSIRASDVSKLSKYIIDAGLLLYDAINSGKTILFEGAQATMLDIDHGTFPFVTSSNCTVGGFFTGSGIFVKDINLIGIAKAYTTRVGEGPFVTELNDNIGNQIRKIGHEYGTTTKRPRRCGWLDTVILRYAKRINNLDCLTLSKLDVLTGLKEIKICDSYVKPDGIMKEFPANATMLSIVKPHYQTFEGWNEDISKCRRFDELPKNARSYVKAIEELVNTPIKYIGVGPNRDEIIIR